MIGKLLRLAELSPSRKELSERLVYIDPTDLDFPPALNLFDFGITRLGRYSPLERGKVVTRSDCALRVSFWHALGR